MDEQNSSISFLAVIPQLLLLTIQNWVQALLNYTTRGGATCQGGLSTWQRLQPYQLIIYSA